MAELKVNNKLEEKKETNNANALKVNQWGIDVIGEFLLEMYYAQTFSLRTNFKVPKMIVRERFGTFLKRHDNSSYRAKFKAEIGTVDIGTLLFRTNYLINTPRGSDYYRIKSLTFYRYFNQKMQKWDERQKNGEEDVHYQKDISDTSRQHSDNEQSHIVLSGDCFEVEEDAEIRSLAYWGTALLHRKSDFILTNMGCYICEINFDGPDKLQEHVELHGEEFGYKSTQSFEKLSCSLIKISYQDCHKSHYFCFTIGSLLKKAVVIDKIILVQPRSMYFADNRRMPHELPVFGSYKFYIDSHMFMRFMEQPIIVVWRYTDPDGECVYMSEQHNFKRSEEFPTVHLSINPNRLSSKTEFKPKVKLLEHAIPENLKKTLANKDQVIEDLSMTDHNFKSYVENGNKLTVENIQVVLKLLLHMEDFDLAQQYLCLQQRKAQICRIEGGFSLKLNVPAEVAVESILSAPDVVIIIPDNSDVRTVNDAKVPNNTNKNRKATAKPKCYTGQVDRVSNRSVTFVCYQKIPEHMTFTVGFRPSRLMLRYQFQALDYLGRTRTSIIKRLLFPENVSSSPPISKPELSLKLVNEHIRNNPQQLSAVRNIANGPNNDCPYIIFGPPGTGKTTTIVEAIMQLYLTRPDTKMLISAGSNSACDEIALRLCNILNGLNDSRAIVRIYAVSVEKKSDNINEILLESSNMYATHFLPDVNTIHEYRIVVCTLGVIGKLCCGKFGRDKLDAPNVFTHVFIDEAAAVTEAEALVGFIPLVSVNTKLILAGDHKQLGAILCSNLARDLGLGVSLMERLLERDCFSVNPDGSYNTSIQTILVYNHRSHPEILNLFSRLYYNGILRPCENKIGVDYCANWHCSPNVSYPIMFHSVFGTTQRMKRGSSMYNSAEIEVVMNYIKNLMYFGLAGSKVSQHDIGVISPYKKQYLCIQDELKLRRWHDIEAGSVEIFQGKEKPIIIISFVRSFMNDLGFLDNPRRLNVAISRPKSFLILIGNPKTLSKSPHFKHIIDECARNNTLVGGRIYDSAEKLSDSVSSLTTMVEHLHISKRPNGKKKGMTPPQSSSSLKKGAAAQQQSVQPVKVQLPNGSKAPPALSDDILYALPKVPANIRVQSVPDPKPKPKLSTATVHSTDLGQYERELIDRLNKLQPNSSTLPSTPQLFVARSISPRITTPEYKNNVDKDDGVGLVPRTIHRSKCVIA